MATTDEQRGQEGPISSIAACHAYLAKLDRATELIGDASNAIEAYLDLADDQGSARRRAAVRAGLHLEIAYSYLDEARGSEDSL